MTPLPPDSNDIELLAQVADLIVHGGAPAVASVLIAVGCARMVRSEIDQMVRAAVLYYTPVEGSA